MFQSQTRTEEALEGIQEEGKGGGGSDILKNFLPNIDDAAAQEQANKILKVNLERYEKMNNLGKTLVSTNLDDLDKMRECCKIKKQALYKSAQQADIISKAIWDYKKEFQSIENIQYLNDNDEMNTNPLLNQEILLNYIDQAFNERD